MSVLENAQASRWTGDNLVQYLKILASYELLDPNYVSEGKLLETALAMHEDGKLSTFDYMQMTDYLVQLEALEYDRLLAELKKFSMLSALERTKSGVWTFESFFYFLD